MLVNRVNPSSVLQGILTPQTQNVDFEKYIGSKTNLTTEADERLYIVTANNINSETSVGQQWNSELTKQSYSLGQIGLPLYRINAYVEYTTAEQAKFEKLANGVSLPNFLENLAKQGINQRKHQAILFGFDKEFNQGITANATLSTLPADSAGATTLLTYNIAELQTFLSGLARTAMDASFGTAKPVIFASSVRVINYIKTAIVPVANYLQNGGVDSVGGTYGRVVGEWLGVGKVDFIADDLLKGNGANGEDTILLIAPGIDDQSKVKQEISQNLVGELNSITYNTMYDAGQGLVRMQRPDDFGIYSSLFTYKMTAGATLRSEAVVSCPVKYN